MSIRIKRAYDAVEADDGYRVLIDRLWPRGRRKEDMRLDAWLRDLAPSTELRRWFGHDPERWQEFRSRYRRELRATSSRELIRGLARRAKNETVTLVFGARDVEHNDAIVLKAVIERTRV